MKATYSPELDNIDIFFKPAKALERMKGAIEKVGITQALKSDTYKPVREAWASGVFLLGYSQITSKQYWLRENPIKNEAPDIFAISLREPTSNEIGAIREILEIEVCEYDENAETNLTTHIKIKLFNKTYNPFTFLLCYIHVKGQMKLIDIIDNLKDIKTSVREIWILFHPGDESIGSFMIARVYLRGSNLEKTNSQYKGNYNVLARIPQLEMVKPFRGSGHKISFINLGMVYIPLPNVKKH